MKIFDLKNKKTMGLIVVICIGVMVAAILLFEKGESLGKVLAS